MAWPETMVWWKLQEKGMLSAILLQVFGAPAFMSLAEEGLPFSRSILMHIMLLALFEPRRVVLRESVLSHCAFDPPPSQRAYRRHCLRVLSGNEKRTFSAPSMSTRLPTVNRLSNPDSIRPNTLTGSCASTRKLRGTKNGPYEM